MSRLELDNILDPEIFGRELGPPHEMFDRWRKEGLHWNPLLDTYKPNPNRGGIEHPFWVATRYDDVKEVSQDQKRFSSYDGGIVIWDLKGAELDRERMNFMNMKPEDHMPIRRLLFPPFAPKNLKKLVPEIERVAKEIVDEVAADDGCEFVFDVASKLPAYIFCELMGIPVRFRDQVVDLGNKLADVETLGNHEVDPMMELFGICQTTMEIKAKNPDDRLLTAILNEPELAAQPMQINMIFLVFAIAGHETTRSTAAHFFYQMSENPDQFELLMSDIDAHLENAIEEVLRFSSPTTNFRRTATMDTTIGDCPVKKGDKVVIHYAAANRDPAVFENPHKFDITRENARKHIAFGIGPRQCIGANVARLELRGLLKQVLTRLPDIRVSGDPEWLKSIWFNALVKLPVSFTPEGSRA